MRVWTCRKCGTKNRRVQQLCSCGSRRPKPRTPKHREVLDLMPYEEWVEKYGERCGICGAEPKGRRLDRDHCHKTGRDRGLLCHRCNRGLPHWADADWLERAWHYMTRDNVVQTDSVEEFLAELDR